MPQQKNRQVFEFETKTKGDLDPVIDDVNNLAEAEQEAARGASNLGDESKKASGPLSTFGKAASAAFGALSGMALYDKAKAGLETLASDFMDVTSAMNDFQAATGVADESLGEYRDVAMDIFKAGFGDSLGDVVDTMAQVRNVTGLTGDQLKWATQDALVFAQAFDRDIVESMRAADTMADVWGNGVGENFDILAGAIQQTGDPANDLLDTFNEYSRNFEELGMGPLDMLNLLNQGLEAGARNTDDIADGIREFGIRLKDGTSDTAMWTLGISDLNAQFKRGEISGQEMLTAVLDGLREIEDPIKRNQLGVEIFGSKWEDAGEAAFLALDPTQDSLESLGSAMSDAEKALTRGIGPAWTRLTRKVRMGLVTAFAPLIEKGLNVAIELLDQLATIFEANLAPAMDLAWGLLKKGAKLVEEFVLNALGMESIDELIGKFRDGLSSVGDWLKKIVGLIPGFIDEIKGAFSDNGLAGVATLLLDKIASGIPEIAQWVYDHIISPIVEYLKGVDWKEVGSEVGGKLKDIYTELLKMSVAIDVWLFEHVILPIVEYLQDVDWGEVKGKLKDLLENLLSLAGRGAASVGEFLYEKVIKPIVEYLKTVDWNAVGGRLKDMLEKLLGWAASGLVDAGTWLWNNVIKPLIDYLAQVDWSLVGNKLLDLLTAFIGLAASGLSSIGEWLWNEVIQPLIDTLSDPNTWEQIYNAAKDLGMQLLNGLLDMLGDLPAKMIQLINDAIPNQINLGKVDLGPAGSVDLGSIDLPDNPIPSRDVGGPVYANRPYMIGKGRFRELFIPHTAGTVVPAAAGAGAGGFGGIVINGGLHLHGVQNPRELKRALELEARRQNEV